MNKLKYLALGLDAIVEAINESKDTIKSVLTDKTIPLKDRWNFFKKYGKWFGDQGGWVTHFNTEKKLPEKEICWYDDFYIERRQIVYMKDIVESILDNIEDNKSGWTSELLVELQEEILAKNLYSFVNDW